MSKVLNTVLDNINNKTVNTFRFDTSSEKVIFNLHNKNENITEISFEGVMSFFYVDSERDAHISNQAKETTEELKSIQYYKDGIGEFMSVNPRAIEHLDEDEVAFRDMVSIPNFALEMKDSSIFIEAERITIDGNTYIV